MRPHASVALLMFLAVVIIAGCADTPDTTGNNPSATPSVAPTPGGPSPLPKGPAIYAGDPVVGTWNWHTWGPDPNYRATYTFLDDGTFARVDEHDSKVERYYGTWNKTGSTKYTLVYQGQGPGFAWENMYYSEQTGYLRNEVVDTFSKAPV